MKGIIVLCEGRHDVAYISMVLANNGYDDYTKKVKDMVKPLGEYFRNKVSSYHYDNNELLKSPILPWILCKQEGQGKEPLFVLLYSMDGLDKVDNYNEIIDDFSLVFSAEGESFADAELFENADFLFQSSQLALAFVLDADYKGIAERVSFIKENYAENLPQEIKNLGHGKEGIIKPKTKTFNFKAIGCYVLSKENEEYGNLEDILLPLMKKGNEGNQSIFNDAEEFLKKHDFQREKKVKNKKVIDKAKTESDRKKAIIGIAGQLDRAGHDNMDIIKKARYLKGKIDGDSTSNNIRDFFRELRKIINQNK